MASVVLWVVLVAALLLFVPIKTVISPTLLLHLSAVLMLLLMIKRLGGGITETLCLYAINFKWLLTAVLVAVGFWLIDHWLMVDLFKINVLEDIANWQQANASFHYLSVFIGTVLLAPVFEELFFRGLIFRSLMQRYHVISAALVSATLFALLHWSWPEFISLFVVALIYALLAQRSKSTLTPIIAHLVHNLMTYIYYSQH